MKGDFRNALPWVILLTLVLISAGVSIAVTEGLENEKDAKKKEMMANVKEMMRQKNALL
jgi:hypothetical protein